MDAFFRTPLLIWSPGRIEPGVDDTLGSQIDLAPTVLQLLQLEATHAFQGISLLTDVAAEKRVVLMGNENAWSIRSAATRCYATGQACFANMPPYCPTGYTPTFTGHRCFSYAGDILTEPDGFDVNAQPAVERDDANLLLARGHRLIDNNSYLLLHDALFPDELRSAAALKTRP